MKIRKTFLLVLILAIASLNLTGCKEKSDHPVSTPPATEVAPAEQSTEDAAKTAEDAAKDAKEAAPEHPTSEHPTEHPK